MRQPLSFQAWNGSSWTTITTFSPAIAVATKWYSGTFTNDTFYSRYRILVATPPSTAWSYLTIANVEVYGDVYVA